MNNNMQHIIENSFQQYAGSVLQSRALVDVRDCLKPSARQIFYSMYIHKLIHSNQFKKTNNAVGLSMADFYIHGDSSCEGIIMRAGQPFSMRYPLIEVEGSYGNLMESGNWAAARYTSSRLSYLSNSLFNTIEKNTILDWRDNYDDTKQYPSVLTSVGYYNICNGSFGVGVGASSSIPQFNLREINEAMEKLLLNPSVDDDDIIPMPDFATGGCLLNPVEVRESLKNGNGKACLLRSVINYDVKDNCLVVTEIPYSVYTNTICSELESILIGEENPGIDRFNDLTGATPLIKIYLHKDANVNKVLQFLYKNTSLQYWYAINLTMLKDGRYPQVFSLRSALNEHIEHEKIVYRRGFEFDKQKAEARLHIVEGLLIARANIDEVIKIIKNAANPGNAKGALIVVFNLTDIQAQAILDMRLSRLTHLEVEKLEKEKNDLIDTVRKIEFILSNERVFNEHLVRGWRSVAEKYGDERRTKITPMEEEETPKLNNKDVVVMVTDTNEVIVTDPFKKTNTSLKTSDFYKTKFKCGYQTRLLNTIYAYDEQGKIYPINICKCPITIAANIIGLFDITDKKYVIYVTNKGTVKKSLISEYNGFKRNPTLGKIRDDEKVIYANAVTNEEYLFMLGKNGKVSKVLTNDFTATGKSTIGIKGMACDVISATSGTNETNIIAIGDEKYKVTSGSDYSVGSKNGLGYAVAENTLKLFAIPKNTFYLIENGSKITYFGTEDYFIKGKGAQGNKTTKEVNIIW